MTPLEDVKGVGPSLATTLRARGIDDAETLAALSQDTIEEIPGIGALRAPKLLLAAQAAVAAPAEAVETDGAEIGEILDDASAVPAAVVESIKIKAAKKVKAVSKALQAQNDKLKAKNAKLKAKRKAAEKKAKAAEKKAKLKDAEKAKAKKAADKAKAKAKKAKAKAADKKSAAKKSAPAKKAKGK